MYIRVQISVYIYIYTCIYTLFTWRLQFTWLVWTCCLKILCWLRSLCLRKWPLLHLQLGICFLGLKFTSIDLDYTKKRLAAFGAAFGMWIWNLKESSFMFFSSGHWLFLESGVCKQMWAFKWMGKTGSCRKCTWDIDIHTYVYIYIYYPGRILRI